MTELAENQSFDRYLQRIRTELPLGGKNFDKSNLYGLRICLTQLLVACLVVISLQRLDIENFWKALLSAVLLGAVAYRIQFVLHDASHKSLFRSAKLNEIVGWSFGISVGVNFSRYRYTHMWHHRLTGSTNDPQYRDYLHGNVSRIRYLMFLISPLMGSRVLPYLGREFLVKNKSSDNNYNEPRVHPAWYLGCLIVVQTELLIISDFGRQPAIAVGFVLGLPTVSLFLARLRAVAEHQDFAADQAGFTRSHKFNLVDYLILYDANFNNHFEHHLYPGLSSRHLKKVRNQVDEVGRPHDTLGTSMFLTILRGFTS